MKKMVLALLLLCSFFGLQSVNAQDFLSVALKSKSSLNGLEDSDYKNVRVFIKIIGNEADKIRLTEDRIRTKCELRLRQVGLTPIPCEEPYECLAINVHVYGNAFRYGIQFHRIVLFYAQETTYSKRATTWEKNGLGLHGGDPEFIIQSLDGPLDDFLNQYLKANAK
jgi:hypothetical protein